MNKRTLVVIGNGMVGHRFIEKVVEQGLTRRFHIVTFCEEPRAAYDRVGLTSFFAHRDAEQLMIARLEWYREQGIELHLGDRAERIDRKRRVVRSEQGGKVDYDTIMLTTGSYPFVPPIEGVSREGVFVYRTIEDLERIIQYGERSRRCAVIGGGLLGLEAAKAAHDLGLETHVVEFAPRLMPRQIDAAGSDVLSRKIESLGVRVHLNKATQEIAGGARVEGIQFADGHLLDVDMVIISAGIRPRDELARDCGLETGERGGVIVNDQLQTSDPDILAAGEVALHRGMVYGLVAPGYDMVDVAARHLAGEAVAFEGSSLSTKLKLLGVDVASFGDYEQGEDADVTPLVFHDPLGGVYKKLIFNAAGDRLLGGILVGDADNYSLLASLAESAEPLPCAAAELAGLGGAPTLGAEALGGQTQVCSCNSVTKGEICAAIAEQGLESVAAVKACTKAGAGCGGCLPLVTDIFNKQLASSGIAVTNHLCEHFEHSRQDLFEIVKIRGIRTFAQLIAEHGTGGGCDVCKPVVASIMASLWNENIVEPALHTLQDTNDRFLANMQRGGLYSVVPRVPGGEITPEKLIVLGQVASKYGLYTKITGGQRIDLFGAQMHQLPDIWEELVDAGFESGHAYGKAVRTVKSCVGSTWCRYGVQDSVGFAIRLEQRYRGIRAPHKIKFAVSGCVRECAEAQCKDFGLIATENGYNLYVCGNGGAKPRHGDLLIADIDELTAVHYIDRTMMYYIFTADKLTRTSVWLENMEGGIDHLREVVVEDKLGVCEELEERMQYLVDTYRCEWKEVVDDPEKRRLFQQFVNTDETQPVIELIEERGQQRPADWPKGDAPLVQIGAATPANANGSNGAAASSARKSSARPSRQWVRVGAVEQFPTDGGASVKYGDVQLAVYRLGDGRWYATQNMCPHKNAFVLSRGIVGTAGGEPKVACPLHKKPFSLETGACLTDEPYSLKVFPVRIESGEVFLELPPQEQLNALLGTELHAIHADSACALCAHAAATP